MKKILFFGVILLGIILFTGCVSQPPTQEPPVQPIQESEETPKKISDNIQESQIDIEKLGDLVVSGEEGGTCVVSEINMWSESKSALDGAYVIGKIPNACPKTEVSYYEERDLRTLNGRIWYKVESGNNVGWITDSFVIQKK